MTSSYTAALKIYKDAKLMGKLKCERKIEEPTSNRKKELAASKLNIRTEQHNYRQRMLRPNSMRLSQRSSTSQQSAQ